jgi:uncharacterized protein
MDEDTDLARLLGSFQSMPEVVVAFSGGVDSTLVLAAAIRALGTGRVLAVTADSPSLARRELDDSRRLALELGARHEVIATDEIGIEGYRKNAGDRCYFCKGELYRKLAELFLPSSGAILVNGANADDVGDWRPGMRAATEAGVRSPLMECGFSKAQVRALAHHLHLEIWDKPSSPCLASRIPYHTEVDPRSLARIEAAEEFLKGEGFLDVRVRHYGTTASIEVPLRQVHLLHVPQTLIHITEQFARIGYHQVEVDPEGLVSGKMNRVLDPNPLSPVHALN